MGSGGLVCAYLQGGDEVGGLEESELADLVDNGLNLGVCRRRSLGRVVPSRCRRGSGLERRGGSAEGAGGAQLTGAAASRVPARHGHCGVELNEGRGWREGRWLVCGLAT